MANETHDGETAPSASSPTPASVEAWAVEYIAAATLEHKRRPPAAPTRWASPSEAFAVLTRPGRPPELTVVNKARGGYGAQSPEARARMIHTFLHHELQAAELMAWAILRFRDAEPEFKHGLLRICLDEIRHLDLYCTLLERRGVKWGAYPVRDWFWQRVPTCSTPLQFVSLMGLGVESANLEHAARFADEFERHGDPEAAHVQRVVEGDEINHVAFGRHWFEKWHGELTFEAWQKELPKPLSPLLMRALPLNRTARERAGVNAAFLDALAAWTPDDT
jgi:uncharacterized ferritin-like protein (DUF455 family)